MAEQCIQQEIIKCSRCKKKHFVSHFRVNRLGRRNKTCLDCNAQKKAADKRRRERIKSDPEQLAKKKAADKRYNQRYMERIKSDPEKLAKKKAADKRANQRYMERIKSDPEKLAKMKRQARKAQIAWWDRIKNDPEKKAAFYFKQCLATYKRDFPDDPRPAPTTRYETYIRRELYRRAERRRKSDEDGPEALARYDAYLARVTPEQAVNDWLELNDLTRFGDQLGAKGPEKTEAELAAAEERLAAIKVIRQNRRRLTRRCKQI
jgi:hypothetical protein